MNIDDRTQRPSGKTPSPPLASYARWHYKQCVMDLNADLIQFGSEGWELVAIAVIPHDPNQAVFHFKRRA